MELVDEMLESYSPCLSAVSALTRQFLHNHCSVMRDVRRGAHTPEPIAYAREAQAESLQGFVEGEEKERDRLPN
jgi:hypothetical protein